MLTQAGIVPDSMTPMYRQLSELIRERIRDGRLAVGERISSEAQLGDKFGVSRITVRQALSELEREGLLERIPGKGTFIREPAHKVERLTRLTGFGENMAALGLTAGYETLQAEENLVSSDITDRLRTPGQNAFVIYRKLLADGRPVGVHTSYLPPWVIGRAPEGTFHLDRLNQGSLYRAVEDGGIVLSWAEEVVEPVQLEENEAELLDAQVGALALRIRRTVYDADNRPIEYVIITYRADSYTFRIELKV